MRPNNFDLIRLLAAIQVVIYHGVEHLKIEGLKDTWLLFILECFPGVPIFFVLSGFLVSASWERSKSLGQYGFKQSAKNFSWTLVLFRIFDRGRALFDARLFCQRFRYESWYVDHRSIDDVSILQSRISEAVWRWRTQWKPVDDPDRTPVLYRTAHRVRLSLIHI